MSLDETQTRLDDGFGYSFGYPDPRDSWGHGRRYRDGCSFLSERMYGDPIPEVGTTTPPSLTFEVEVRRNGPFRVTGP